MSNTHLTPDNPPRKPQREDGRDDTTIPENRAVPLETLLAYAEKVISEMAKNRDIRSDNAGKPGCTLRSSGEDAEASWLHFVADLSGLGMALDMPLVLTAYSDENSLEWNFGVTPIAKTPRSATPKEAADALDMDVLLVGFHRFVVSESVLFPTALTKDAGQEKGPVHIALEDGCCRECEGRLEVTGVDDVTMSVECGECGDSYELEHDAFDAGFDYVLEFLARRRPTE